MSGRPAATGSAWHSRDQGNRYVTRAGDAIGETIRTPDGWVARVGKRARGSLSSLGAAMDAADRMLSDISISGDGNGREPSAAP